MDPIIRWAGSKKKLIPVLRNYYEMLGTPRYIEPFCGSACLLLAIDPPTFIISDVNSWLIETYKTIKSSPEAVHAQLSTLEPTADTYYRIRALDPKSVDPVNKAAYFLYLNRHCFNGLFRTNNLGHFNVPFSGQRNGATISAISLVAFSKFSKRGRFLNLDFAEAIRKNIKKNDFVYLDPPYAVANQRIFRQYSPSTFGLHDLNRLSSTLDHIEDVGAKFVLSYADSPEVKPIAKRWKSRKVKVQRNISANTAARTSANEVIVTNIDKR